MNAEVLSDAKNLFDSNKLKFNESKTKNIIFNTDRRAAKFEPVLLLGVTLYSGLHWAPY